MYSMNGGGVCRSGYEIEIRIRYAAGRIPSPPDERRFYLLLFLFPGVTDDKYDDKYGWVENEMEGNRRQRRLALVSIPHLCSRHCILKRNRHQFH